MKRYSKEEDEFLKLNYKEMTHIEISLLINRTSASVRNRCYRLGLVDVSDNWTDKQIEILKDEYKNKMFNNEIDLNKIVSITKKLKSNIVRKAKELGLTNINRKKKKEKIVKISKAKFNDDERKEFRKKLMSNRHKVNGHPMLGKFHSKESLEKMSIKSTKSWASKTEEQKQNIILKASKTKERNGTMQTMNRANASWGAAWREIGGYKKYYRSKWEANYARYLEWLKQKGDISDWKHEPETFWFDGIKRGCMSYLPDFKVTESNGSIAYHEVKGWMDDRSKTKIKRMAKYHPNVKLIVIDSKSYASIKKVMQPIIKDWETDSKGR